MKVSCTHYDPETKLAVAKATLTRNKADDLFHCTGQGCALTFGKYMQAYNHLTRAEPHHCPDTSGEDEVEGEEDRLVDAIFASSQKVSAQSHRW